jgi:hypothetical protein
MPVSILNSSPETCDAVPLPADAMVSFSRIGFGVGDEFWQGLGRTRYGHGHDQGFAGQRRHRREVAGEIESEITVKRRVDRIGRRRHEQRVAVRCRLRHGIGGDIGAGSGPIFDDEGLTQPLR